MRLLETDRTASVLIRGHAFVQNIRRDHCDFDHDTDHTTRLEAAFNELCATLQH